MDTTPTPSNSLERYYHIDGDQLERHYKEHLSHYRQWEQRSHADKWLLFPGNMGTHPSIDKTSLSNGELYTILTNKAAKGRKGSIVAIVEGTGSEEVIRVLDRLSESQKLRPKILFEEYPDLKQGYSLTHSLRMIYNKNSIKAGARLFLAKWYNRVADSEFKSFNTIAATVYEHHEEILNFFINRSTNASAESFNAKIKAFRASLRGVLDIKFFLFRLTKIYA